MAIAYNASAVASGLVFNVDAGDSNSFSPPPTGSLLFASNSRVRLPTSSLLQFGSGNFTIEFWMNGGGTQTTFATIADASTNNTAICVGVGTNNGGIAGRLSFFVFGGTGTLNSTTAVLDNTWRHIACVKNGATGLLFVNGVLEASTTAWGAVSNAFLSGGCLGGSAFGAGNASDNWFAGNIANFAVYNTAVYSSNFTVPTAPPPVVTGLQLLYNAVSSATYINDSSTNNFTSTIASGTPAWSPLSPLLTSPTSLSSVEVLVVAGGGAGGAAENNTNGGGGGGGGAGGVVYSPTFPVTASTSYPVIRGAGGLPNTISQGYGNNGENSSFGTLVAIGGGGGGGGDLEGAGGTVPALPGGSGGGAGGDVTTEISAAGTPGQGNAGGARGSPGNNRAGAGGGGAGQPGSNGARGINNTGRGGSGGNGVAYDISGTTTFYGGGGGGGASSNASSGVQSSVGGLGGGGAGAGDTAAFQGTNFTGGGGGGGYGAFGLGGGGGGSGIVIVRYPGGPLATGGTITSVAGNTIHTFQSSGTFTTLRSNAWRDISGQGNNGVCVNNPTYNNANGGFLTFNGTTQYVNCGAGTSLNVGNTITVNAWFFVGSTAVYQPIVAKHTSDGTLGWEIANSSGGFRATLRPNATQIDLTGGVLALNNWYMGTMTFDGTTLRLYLNGVQTGSATGGPVILNSPQPLIIASREIGANFFNGRIAQVSMYNRALSADEVQQNFNALRGRFGI